jgi:hypothetical protein
VRFGFAIHSKPKGESWAILWLKVVSFVGCFRSAKCSAVDCALSAQSQIELFSDSTKVRPLANYDISKIFGLVAGLGIVVETGSIWSRLAVSFLPGPIGFAATEFNFWYLNRKLGGGLELCNCFSASGSTVMDND